MEPASADMTGGDGPYMPASVKDVEDAIKEKGLIVMFSALNQNDNAQVTRRNV